MAKPGKAPKKAKQLTKGHVVTKLPKRERPSLKKGRISKRVALVRRIIHEISGHAPYERKIMELVQAGGAKEDKKALKIAKRRLGTHRRGMKKREDLRQVVRAMRHRG